VSAYWASGGTGLLDTVGGEIERWGREHSPGVVVTLWLIVLLKLVGAAAPLVFAGLGAHPPPTWTRTRHARTLAWVAAVGLTLYGTVLTVAGLLIKSGVSRRATMPTNVPSPGTPTSGIPGSRSGVSRSRSSCGVPARKCPNKPAGWQRQPAGIVGSTAGATTDNRGTVAGAAAHT
jgi:hypothetical protein